MDDKQRAQDVALLVSLTRDVLSREVLLEQARRDRRSVMLRLSETGATYAQLAELGDVGETTVWKELKKARDETSNDLTLS